MKDPRVDCYKDFRISDKDKATGKYREHLGGGASEWSARGRFQVAFLAQMGLLPHHRLLDIGCGPLRGGIHFIRYLNATNYYGIDYNADFIDIATSIVATRPGLTAKQPTLRLLDGFRFGEIGDSFDFALAFSVLNFTTESLRAVFFDQLPAVLLPGARAYITHTDWFTGSLRLSTQLALTRVILSSQEFCPNRDPTTWGWTGLFPILEITRRP
jgi:SAM-dependent methyltransferase